MAATDRDIIYSILKYLGKVDLAETARTLERESGMFFNVTYFEELVINGSFDEAEEYIGGFTTVHDNAYSTKTIFEIRKQKFLEALENGERSAALNIVMDEFKTFEQYNANLIPESTQLLTLDDFRSHGSLSEYGDMKKARRTMVTEIRRCLEENPLLKGKLLYPAMNAGPPMRFKLVHNQNADVDPDHKLLYAKVDPFLRIN
ncbi:hypothetical protein FEM48_Zijuj06G0137800 [Ziziphus jujuba var. spinosa]|uniref:CTLH domain-containing protein n=1 Tax=Ziziphus jujuba var. spinosa TaxID=714518 RepID=A0A978V9M7_ZIZJJ|nr:hypothetical protein FEM48_Zijuj06G0137800 [Ziziphus jujuba var. spinosa]